MVIRNAQKSRSHPSPGPAIAPRQRGGLRMKILTLYFCAFALVAGAQEHEQTRRESRRPAGRPRPGSDHSRSSARTRNAAVLRCFRQPGLPGRWRYRDFAGPGNSSDAEERCRKCGEGRRRRRKGGQPDRSVAAFTDGRPDSDGGLSRHLQRARIWIVWRCRRCRRSTSSSATAK